MNKHLMNALIVFHITCMCWTDIKIIHKYSDGKLNYIFLNEHLSNCDRKLFFFFFRTLRQYFLFLNVLKAKKMTFCFLL